MTNACGWTACWVLAACLSVRAGNELADVDIPPPPVRAHSGRFYVFSSDSMTKLMLLNWAEDLTERMGRMVGSEPLFGDYVIRIVVNDGTNAPAGLLLFETQLGDRRALQLTVNRYDEIDRGDADEAFCRLLVRAYILDGPGAPGAAVPLPDWFSWGLAQNLYPLLRARNSREAALRWESGEFPTVSTLVRTAEGGAAVDKTAAGVLMAWLLSNPGGEQRFREMLNRLSSGGGITPETLISLLPGCRTIPDVEDAWDRWLLRQRRRVNLTGAMQPDMIARLRAELLIPAELSGMAMRGGVDRNIGYEELIARRREGWVRGVAEEKRQRLQALAIGRGPEMGGVVEAYVRFFEELRRPGRTRTLEKLLAEAEGRLAALAARTREEPVGEGDRQ